VERLKAARLFGRSFRARHTADGLSLGSSLPYPVISRVCRLDTSS
jgi:hypothetical protein